jgi:hypothetical protein
MRRVAAEQSLNFLIACQVAPGGTLLDDLPFFVGNVIVAAPALNLLEEARDSPGPLPAAPARADWLPRAVRKKPCVPRPMRSARGHRVCACYPNLRRIDTST